MIPVSSGFFKAIRNKAPQDIRLEFRNDDYTYGEVLTGKDIAVTAGGLTLTQVLNSATDIEFGRAVMAELKVMLINADGRFTDFNFNRQFIAKLGVYVTATQFYVGRTNNGMLGLIDAQGTMRIYDFDDGKVIAGIYAEERTEYYLRGGADMDAATLIMWGTKLYVANSQGQLEGAFEIASDGKTPEIFPTPTEYPLGITEDDVLTWISEGVCVEVLEDTESEGGWEYIPLGCFKGERPESVRGKLIEFTAHDKMQLFDIPAADFITGLTFPCTLMQIFEKLCSFCRVSYILAKDFVNSGKTFDKNPFKHTDYTCREILAYIAEAAGAYARMAPGDYAEFVYFTRYPEMPTFRRIDRFEMSESEFKTPSISRLEVYSSYADQLNTSGTGDVVYGISDNPLLYAENVDQAAELQPYVDAIYQRIARIDPYHPSSFRAEAHPAVECGDIIQVVNDYGETRRFPVFAQTLIWTGFAKATYENTGGVIRQNAPFTQRELEQLKKKSVKTKDLWTYIDSYLGSDEGVASINMAVGGKFVTEDQLSGFITETELNAGVEAYINGAEGIAKLTDSLSGVFVTTGEYNKSVRITASSQVFVKAAGASSYTPSSITLTAETKGTGLTFQWYLNDTAISGATGTTLTITSGSFSGSSAAYKIVATDSAGNTFTDVISIAKLADGTNGKNGVTYYTWIKYADSPTSGISDDPSGKKYIGIAPNKTTPTESSNYSDYTWSLIKGADGAPGTPGSNGITYYTWIKYADNASGSGISNDPTGKKYIGLAHNKTTATESNTPSDYTWSLIKGADGAPGSNGVDGYTILLSDEFIEVPVNQNRYPTASASYTCTVSVYKGLTALSGVSVAVSSRPSGVTATVSGSTVTISVGTGTAIADSGKVVLSISAGGMTLTANIVIQANMNSITSDGYTKTVALDADIERIIDRKTGLAKLTLSAKEDVTEENVPTGDIVGAYESVIIDIGISNGYSFVTEGSGSGMWYRSQNAGVANSFSIGIIEFEFSQETVVALECKNSAEYGYDYGIVSNIDVWLSNSASLDSSGVFHSFKNETSRDIITLYMTIPAGSHFITVKYIKDGSSDQNDDCFKVRAVATKTIETGRKSTIALTQNDIEIASADIKFTGFVTFESLSTPGATTIDGGNINTDNLYVKQVYLDDGKNSQPILHSELEENGSGEVFLGFREYMANPANPHILKIYAKDIYLMQPGDNEDSKNTLRFSMTTRRIIGNTTWFFDELSV